MALRRTTVCFDVEDSDPARHARVLTRKKIWNQFQYGPEKQFAEVVIHEVNEKRVKKLLKRSGAPNLTGPRR